MAHLDVPGIGMINVYSTHMASSPTTQEEREKQVMEEIVFINSQMKADIDIFGGDFNFDNTNPAYKIIQNSGFVGYDVGVDHIMIRGGRILSGEEVFSDHFVSDHSGILVEVSK